MDTPKKYPLGLALSGGGVRGFAHIGALRALEEYGVKPDIIAGVSAGSIVAVFYAAGFNPDDIFDLFTSIELKSFLQLDFSKAGFLRLDRLQDFLREHLPVQNIEQLNIPTIVGATDIDNQREMPFSSGEIAPRVAASCSLPVVFTPVKIDDVYCIDGGVLHNLPSYYLRPICDKVIGVNVSPSTLGAVKLNMRSLAYRAYKIMTQHNVKVDKATCDLLIDIKAIQHYGTFEVTQAQRIARKAYFETIKVLSNTKL
ncbi:MAG: patatin-like phospholipase family protein [Muribaculaceae bacterium]|nr:patatin-like phospholipase family protein [Muribaculaceae bacterium]